MAMFNRYFDITRGYISWYKSWLNVWVLYNHWVFNNQSITNPSTPSAPAVGRCSQAALSSHCRPNEASLLRPNETKIRSQYLGDNYGYKMANTMGTNENMMGNVTNLKYVTYIYIIIYVYIYSVYKQIIIIAIDRCHYCILLLACSLALFHDYYCHDYCHYDCPSECRY